jgi:hypothetical protein
MPMTREEILALGAGRELDALVAEHVMGWSRGTIGPEDDLSLVWFPLDGGGWLEEPRPWSTDIRAAWQVVEKASGFHADAPLHRKFRAVALFYPQEGQVGCQIYECVPGRRIFDVRNVFAENVASTAPLAICRAALLAVLA